MADIFSTLFKFLKPKGANATQSRLDRIVATDRERFTKPPIRDTGRPTSKLKDRLDRIKDEREANDAERDERRRENDPEEQYLNGEQWVQVVGSSNVAAFRYLGKDMVLEVQFLDGSMYDYTGVPEWKALEFFHAGGRGTAVWDYLRIRGTKLGHQHPHYLVIGPSKGAGKSISKGFGTRKWEASARSAKAHAKRVERQSKGPSGYAHPKKKDPVWEARKASLKATRAKKT